MQSLAKFSQNELNFSFFLLQAHILISPFVPRISSYNNVVNFKFWIIGFFLIVFITFYFEQIKFHFCF
jgi:hypothetical protein